MGPENLREYITNCVTPPRVRYQAEPSATVPFRENR